MPNEQVIMTNKSALSQAISEYLSHFDAIFNRQYGGPSVSEPVEADVLEVDGKNL